jgi:hypothetical protein
MALVLSDPDSAPREKYLQSAVLSHLPATARREVLISELGMEQAWGGNNGKLDVLIGLHGIELKVLLFPRPNSTPSRALYDIGQISSDYSRLATSSKLISSELILLLYGPLVGAIGSPQAVNREFQNRMFVDLETSKRYGELLSETNTVQRLRQLQSITKMGLDIPHGPTSPTRRVFVDGDFALISIPVTRQAA